MLGDLLRDAASDLPGETPALDAQVLLAHVIGRDRSWVLAHPEAHLTAPQQQAFQTALQALQTGTPLPYVLGHWEFFGLDFEVTPDVLIPRPETELLVESALRWLHSHPTGRSFPQPVYRFLDVGTGSGCIPITLAVHVPRASITATDISRAALDVARRNAARHGVQERISFIECDLAPDEENMLWDETPTGLGHWSSVDVVAANLPYIPSAILKDLPIYGQEPTLALDGGEDGLDLIRRLLAQLVGKMEAGCLILLEIEANQGRSVLALAETAFPAASVEIRKDLAGFDRLVIIET